MQSKLTNQEFRKVAQEHDFDILTIMRETGYSRAQVYQKLKQTEDSKDDDMGYADLSAFIPPGNDFSDYIELEWYKELKSAYQAKLTSLLIGPAGSGKTESARHLAAETGSPFLRISCNEETNAEELFGSMTIKNNSLYFIESLFSCMLQTQSIILVDEINAANPALLFHFHQLLDSGSVYLKADGKGKIIKKHENCHLIFAMNPGNKQYLGTKKMNHAFIDRMVIIFTKEFGREEIKKALAHKASKIDNAEFESIIELFLELRKLGNQEDFALSIRRIDKYIDLRQQNLSIKQTVFMSFLNFIFACKDKDVFESALHLSQAKTGIEMEEKNE